MRNRHFFTDKVVIITGASSGIGEALARQMAALQAKVVLAARSTEKIEAIAEELGSNALAITVDVSKENDCQRLIEESITHFGRIDILVNNAGISMRAAFEDVDLQVLHRLMDVNFWGCVYCSKYALPHLLKSKGSLVGVSSIAGYVGLPCRTGYSASKFAMNGFLETLRAEYQYQGLHVMTFAPNFTASNVRFSALTADGSPQGATPRKEEKMMSAEDCAKCLIKGLRHRRKQMVLTLLGKLTVYFFRVFLPGITRKTEYKMMFNEPDSPLRKF